MTSFDFHPLANLFPLLEGTEFDALAEDVRTKGLLVPIVVHDGKILDGRNRYRACMAAGRKPAFEAFTGDDPLSFVISINLKRRHLNESQRAMVAAKLVTTGHGGDRSKSQICDLTQAKAAKRLNVGKRSVESAAKVLDQGSPMLQRAVETGKVPVSLAVRFTAHDAATQNAIVRRVEGGVKPMEALRLQKAAKINENLIKNPTGKFRVLYADPPWSYGGGSQPTSAARDHYPTMSLEDICALPVKDWTEDDAVLFLWVTSPFLMKSFQVVEDWGFEYKAHFVWDKVTHNMGHYNSVRHELLLICTRGACQPDVRKLYNSVVREKRTEHSKKPAIFYDMIETLYPHGTRLELFQRGAGRQGWACYGLESAKGGAWVTDVTG